MKLLEVDRLTLGYEGQTVIRDLSFSMEKGDYVLIVGENGSGKSTLTRAILGLKKPMSGEIRFGEGVKKAGIGYLPQQTVVQRDFPASVWEIVLSGCLGRMGGRPFYSASEKEKAEHNLALLGIGHLRKSCYRTLSGGQQQRVLLARALSAAGELLLLDEPVAGLDAGAAAEMYRIIAARNQEGLGVMMVTHNLADALPYANHVLTVGHDKISYKKVEGGVIRD